MSSSSSQPELALKSIGELAELGAEAYYIPNFLSGTEADDMFLALEEKYPFHQEKTVVFGKIFDQPRLTRFMGDEGKSYNYSGQVRPAVSWIPEVLVLRDRIHSFCLQLRPKHSLFNVALGNRYKDGNDYIGEHADDETDHEHESFIASISLGAVRDFHIKDKRTKKTVLSIPLAHGSLLLMGGNFQQKLKHCLPKRKKVKDPRINLTFRVFNDSRAKSGKKSE